MTQANEGAGVPRCPLNPQFDESQVDYFIVEVEFFNEAENQTQRANLGPIQPDATTQDVMAQHGGGVFWFQAVRDKKNVGLPICSGTLAGEPKWRQIVADTLNAHNIDPQRDATPKAPAAAPNPWAWPPTAAGVYPQSPNPNAPPIPGAPPGAHPSHASAGMPPGMQYPMPQGPVMTPWGPMMPVSSMPGQVQVGGMQYPIAPGLPPDQQQALLNRVYEEQRRDAQARAAEDRMFQLMQQAMGMGSQRADASTTTAQQNVEYLRQQLNLKDQERGIEVTRLTNEIARLNQLVQELQDKSRLDATANRTAMTTAQTDYNRVYTENLDLRRKNMELAAQLANRAPPGEKPNPMYDLAKHALPGAMPVLGALVGKAMGLTPEMMQAAGGGQMVEPDPNAPAEGGHFVPGQ